MKSQDRVANKKNLPAGGSNDRPATAAPASESQPAAVRPNQAMLDAMKRIAEIQKGMNPKKGKDSLEHLSEAREGAMYGYGSDE
jgi:hypothetical protein